MIDLILNELFETFHSFLLVIVVALIVLTLDFLLPKFSDWTRFAFFLVLGTYTMIPAIEAFSLMQGLATKMSAFFMSLYPVLTAGMVASGGALSIVNLHPLILMIMQFAVVLTEQWLVPLLVASMILDYLTRLMPSISFSKMADLIRTSLLAIVSAIVVGYSIFLSINGIMAWSVSGMAAEPLKVLLRQNIPLIGSFLTDSLSTISKYSNGLTTITGTWLMTGIWTVALIPTFQTLVTAFCYKWTAAIIEPFTDDDISGFLDDLGKALFVLCAISFLIAFAFFYTAMFSVVLLKLFAMMR